MVIAAYWLSELTGDSGYAQATDRYVEAFLSCCVAANGMFQWGNHAYYDPCGKKVITFHNGYHELRPIVPAWSVFWRHAPDKTEKYLRTMADRHIYDHDSGGFNRHDDGMKGHAFIEAGGILCESLAWLYSKTGDMDLLDTVLSIARYSYGHRDPVTGLVPNEPDMGRWDSEVCTTEIGLWAQCLLRAYQLTDSGDLIEIARSAVTSYMDRAFDKEAGRFFGQISTREGKPVIPEQSGYWPRQYSDPWNTDQWPTHDYPMSLAEACLSLHQLSGDSTFLEGVRRWAAIAIEDRPGRHGTWAYAESYGRCIHFLTRAGLQLGEERFLADAQVLADEAGERFFANGMFQGYPSDHVYESVDGVGFLMLALMSLETRQSDNSHGFGF